MKKVILCFILLFSSLAPYVSADNDLTHEDMIRLYGDGYADSFLGTVVEANAKLAVNEAENRELLDTWITNNMDYLKGRARSYVDSMQGAPEGANFAEKMLYGYAGFFKEVGIGAYTLGQNGWNLLKDLFGSNDDGTTNYLSSMGADGCTAAGLVQGSTLDGGGVSFQIWCDYQLYNTKTSQTAGGFILWWSKSSDYHYITLGNKYYKYGVKAPGPYATASPPAPSIGYGMALINYYGAADDGWIIRKKSNSQPVVDYTPTIINHINNGSTSTKSIKIPTLTPQATCPEGQRVIVPDGLGGYLDGNGQQTDVSQCTIIWKQPVIDRDDTGNLQIDTGDGNGPQKLEDDGSGSSGEDEEGGLGSIAAIISALADAVKSLAGFVTNILDGLLGLFVPDDLSFVSDEINRITDELTSKISIVEDIKTMLTSVFVPTDVNPLSNISLDLPIVGKPISFGDLAFINQHVPTVRRVLGGFIWLITIVYVYRKITGRGGVMEK